MLSRDQQGRRITLPQFATPQKIYQFSKLSPGQQQSTQTAAEALEKQHKSTRISIKHDFCGFFVAQLSMTFGLRFKVDTTNVMETISKQTPNFNHLYPNNSQNGIPKLYPNRFKSASGPHVSILLLTWSPRVLPRCRHGSQNGATSPCK